jgi:DNA mismatch endonuclease, patch repair protein
MTGSLTRPEGAGESGRQPSDGLAAPRVVVTSGGDAAIGATSSPAAIGYPHPSSAAAQAVMRGNRRVDTRPERQVRSLLHRRGYRFRKDYLIRAAGVRVRPDVVFTRQRVAVFIDGCYWHRCPQHGTSPRVNSHYWGPKLDRNVARDQRVDEALTAAGWVVVRLWEHDAPEGAVARIAAALTGRSAPQ